MRAQRHKSHLVTGNKLNLTGYYHLKAYQAKNVKLKMNQNCQSGKHDLDADIFTQQLQTKYHSPRFPSSFTLCMWIAATKEMVHLGNTGKKITQTFYFKSSGSS